MNTGTGKESIVQKMNSGIQPIRGNALVASALPFSPAIRAGDYVFLSGLGSVDQNGKIIHDTFENEARRTYQNIGHVFAAAGLDFSRVVQVRCYLSRQEYWEEHNRIYREFFAEPFPARTTLIGCLGDLLKYEVDLIAYAGKQI